MNEIIWFDMTTLGLSVMGFLYGWFVGRTHGIGKGAAEMFDQMYDNGEPVQGKQHTRRIEISLDDA